MSLERTGQKDHLPGSTGIKIQLEPITALYAEIFFSDLIPNLKVIAAGQVFLRLQEKIV